VQESGNFCYSQFLSRTLPAAPSKYKEVILRLQALILIFAVIGNSVIGNIISMNKVGKEIINKTVTYQPSPWIEGEWFWVYKRIIIILSRINIYSPSFWNNKS
jgi:hypothetical protein